MGDCPELCVTICHYYDLTQEPKHRGPFGEVHETNTHGGGWGFRLDAMAARGKGAFGEAREGIDQGGVNVEDGAKGMTASAIEGGVNQPCR